MPEENPRLTIPSVWFTVLAVTTTLGLLMALPAFLATTSASALADSYLRGYTDGLTRGVNRALHITPEIEQEMWEQLRRAERLDASWRRVDQGSMGSMGSGGHIIGNDKAGETWYFRAPMSVLRQLPAAVNGTIAFSLRQSGPQVSLFDDDVVIIGPAGRLSYRFQTPPGTDWTDFSVRLVASEGWTWNWNSRATQAQIDSVLAAPTGLDIRGEYVTGQDEGSLDNFVLKGPEH